MFKLNLTKTEHTTTNYKSPTYYINIDVDYPPTYNIELDLLSIYMMKEDIINRIIYYTNEIKRLVLQIDTTKTLYNQKQVSYLLQNNPLDIELICLYDENKITTTDFDKALERILNMIGEIGDLINEQLALLNKKFNNIFTYYDGDYINIDNFVENLTIENQLLPLENFED